MADQEPISALPLDSTAPVSGDVLPIVHAGTTYKINTDTLGLSSLTPKYVLFANASGNLAQDSGIQYDPISHTLNANILNASSLTANQAVVSNGSKDLVSLQYTASASASTLMLRNPSGNSFCNNLNNSFTTSAASSTPISLTAASAKIQEITGSTTQAQIIILPNATTLATGFSFIVKSIQTQVGTIIKDNSGTQLFTVYAGQSAEIICTYIGNAAGSWDWNYTAPQNIAWSTTTLNMSSTNLVALNVASQTNIDGFVFRLMGASTGIIYFTPQANSGTYNFNMPTDAGTSGYFLTSGGGGSNIMTWTNPGAIAVTGINGTANQISLSASVGNVTVSLTDGVSIGASYQVVTPPTHGLIVQGITGIGTNSPIAGTQFHVLATSPYIAYLSGTQTAVDGNTFQTALYVSNIMSPTSGSGVSAGAIVAPQFIIPNAQTASFAFGLYVNPIVSSNVGTISTFAQISLETAGSAGGTITTHIGLRVPALASGTNRYGLYVAAPTGGTVATAAYLANLAVGATGVTPPSSTGIYCAGKIIVGATSLQSDNLTNDLQLGTIGTTKGMSIGMTNTFIRLREIAIVNQLCLSANWASGSQDSGTYNSWLFNMYCATSTFGTCTWQRAPVSSTTLATLMTLTSDPVLAVGTTAYINDAIVPIQINAVSTSSSFFGVNKDGAYGALFGFSNNSGLFSTCVLIRSCTADPISFYVNNTTLALQIDSNTNSVFSNQILTTATDGFIYVPTCAGAPTGVPRNFAGRAPLVYDTTNNKLWFYNFGSSAWKGAVFI